MRRLYILFLSLFVVAFLSNAFLAFFSHNAFADSTPTNLIANASLETADPSNSSLPQSWLKDKWGTNTATYSYDTTGHTGNRSVSVTMSSHTSGDAKWYSAAEAVNSSAKYTYSDYYKSSIANDVVAQLDDGKGNYTYVDLGSVSASTTWRQYTTTLTTLSTTKSVAIFHLIAGVGTLSLDDASLVAASVTPPAGNGSNLVANSSLETANPNNSALPQSWNTDKWGTNNSTFSYDTAGHTGGRSVSVKVSSYTSGDAKWYSEPEAVFASHTYAYSDYYKSSISSDVVAQFDNGSGDYTYVDLGSAPASTSWKAYATSFTVPTGISSVAIFHLIAGVGNLSLDDVSLTDTTGTTTPPTPPVSSTINLIPNSSVENVAPNDTASPQSWYKGQWGNNTASFTYPTSGHTGNRSVGITMSNFSDGGANWTYDAQSVTPGKVYSFSNYYQSNTVTQVIAAVTLTNGTIQYVWLGNPYTSNGVWSQFFATFTMPAGAVSAVVYQTISANGYFTADDYSFGLYTPRGFSSPLVTVTFDDGIATQYTNALPTLQKYGLKGTFYIISGDIDVCSPDMSTLCYLTRAQLTALSNAGQEIGSHTVSHPDLTTLSATEVATELSASQTTLQNWLNLPITNFAAPYGNVNQAVLAQTRNYYVSQRGVEAGYNSIDNYNQQDLLVQDVDTDTTTAQVESYIDYAKATNTWLILVYHDINADTTVDPGYDTKPKDFSAQMAYLKASGVRVQTINEALTTVSSQVAH